MSRRADIRRSARRMLLAVVGLFLVSSLFPVGSATAHVFTKLDGNDSPSKIDLRSASVSHTPSSVVHRVQTYNAWTPQSLQQDSFFVIGINRDSDRAYERCAFIYYTTRLRGQLSNCGAQFISSLPVVKSSVTTARITIPKSQTGSAYRWWAGTVWVGAPPCRNVCRDFAPNRLPDILHDLAPPTITMNPSDLRVWENSTTPSFDFPFSVSDAHTSVRSWKVERRFLQSTAWTQMSSGVGDGTKNPTITGLEGERAHYRVVATDKHGNTRVGPLRLVYVPRDQASAGFAGSYPSSSPVDVADPAAFGGSYAELDAGEFFTYNFGSPGNCLFQLIGPRTSTWTVSVKANSVPQPDISSDGAGGQRELLFSAVGCLTIYEFTVVSGTGFGIDAALG